MNPEQLGDTAMDIQVSPIRSAAAADVQDRFAGSGIWTWYGQATGHYWAYLPPPHYRLVEAEHPQQLEEKIISAQGRHQ